MTVYVDQPISIEFLIWLNSVLFFREDAIRDLMASGMNASEARAVTAYKSFKACNLVAFFQDIGEIEARALTNYFLLKYEASK